MNYYAARQRQSDQRWDYTIRNNTNISPIGYCEPYRWIGEFFDKFGLTNHYMIDVIRSYEHKHHNCGHNTKKEAEECYREYLLDQHLQLNKNYVDTQHKCVVCCQWTSLYAEIDMSSWNLCLGHNNRTEVEKLFSSPTEIWKS